MVEVVNRVTCKNCGSDAVVKYGSYKGVQRYFCKVCQRKFKGDNALFHMKVSPEYISIALSSYYSGSSITDIRDHLNQEYGYYPSKHIVFEWVDKYTSLASKQFQDTRPVVVSDTWIADETVLRLDKDKKIWFFDIIDKDTRFLLASRASFSRTTRDAQILIDRAIKKAGKSPKTVLTDKLASYLDVNYGKGAEHQQGSPFRFKETGESTARIERFHGTIKDRTKVMRAFRDIETLRQFMDGYLIYYNYFKRNEALNGKTPAEAAHIDYKIKNWKELSQIPVSKQAEIETHKPSPIPKSLRITPPRPRITPRFRGIPR